MKTKTLSILFAFLLGGVETFAAYGDTFTVNESDYSITYRDVSSSDNPLSVRVSSVVNKTSSNVEVVIPDEVTNEGITYQVVEIGDGALKNKRVSKVTLPTGLLYIYNNAFYGNPLTEVVIPASVRTISQGAFENCTSLQKVYWLRGDDVTWNPVPLMEGTNPAECFNSCTSLTDIFLIGTKWGKISDWPMQPSGTTTVKYWVDSSITSMKSNVTGVLKNYYFYFANTMYAGIAEPYGLTSSTVGTGWIYPQDDTDEKVRQQLSMTPAKDTYLEADDTNKELIGKSIGSARTAVLYRGVTIASSMSVYVNTNSCTSVSLDPTSATVKAGQTVTLTPALTAEHSPLKYIKAEWSSSNTDVATVSEDGVVTTLRSGEATITYTAKNLSGTNSTTATVTVTELEVSNLKLNGGVTTSSVNLDKGTTTMTFTPSFDCEGDKDKVTLTWASDDTSIATIGSATSLGEAENTLMLKNKVGTTNITCSHTNADGTVESATIKLTAFRPTVSSLAFSKDVYQVVKGSTVSVPITFNADVPEEDVKITYATSGSSSYVTLVEGSAVMGDVTNSVKGVTNGSYTIYARHTQNDGTTLEATAKVIVANSFADSFTLDPSSQMMSPGETVTLTPKATGSGAPSSPSYTWKSSNTAVATVSSGTVTARGYGSALITCTMTATGQEATCKVTVRDPSLINVGTFFYKQRSDATLEVTNCAGGKPSNLTDDCYGYSGTLEIPATVTYGGATYTVSAIGQYAFYNQIDLQGLVIPESIQQFDASSCEGAKNLGRVSFKSKTGLLEISDRAFYGCKKLNKLTLPNSTLSIGKSAFQSCDALEDLILPTSLNIIGDYAFADCPLLNEIDLPETNLNIQTGAFQNDIALTEITLPAGLQGLGASAFEGCSALEEVTFNTESDQAFTVGEDAFAGTAVKRVNIANLDSWIQTNFSNPAANPASISHHIYQDGAEIINAIVPEGPMFFANNVFYGCSSLKTLQLPSTLEQVNDNTLYGCTALEKVYVRATFVPDFLGTGDPSLMNDVFNKAELCVPAGKESKYKKDSWWGLFKTISGSVTDAQCATPTVAYTGGKLVFSCETEDVDYVYSVKVADAKNGSGNNVAMSNVYTVSVYATKAGMANSDTATLDVEMGSGSGLKGDVDGNGQVTITDAVAVVDIILSGK